MTILNDYFNYTIGAHWFSAIFNNDFSSLSDSEEKQFSDFMDKAGNVGFNNLRDATWTMPDPTEDAHFSRCEISGLHSDCYTLRLCFTNPSLAASDFPVLVHNHETGARFYIHTLADFIEYLNETDEFNTYTLQERTA